MTAEIVVGNQYVVFTRDLDIEEQIAMHGWLEDRLEYKFRRSRIWVDQETHLYNSEIVFIDCPDIALMFKLVWG